MNDEEITMRHQRKRIGFVGVGEQGWNNLLPTLGVLRQANVVAVCDPRPQRRNLAASTYGASPYASFDDMLATENLDAVIVASHPAVHESVLRATIPLGVPTFIEKPPTLTTDALRELVDLNRNHRTLTSVGLNFVYTEPLQFVRAAIDSSDFGELSYLRVAHLNNKPNEDLWLAGERMRSFLLSQMIHAVGVLYGFGTPADATEEIDTYSSGSGLFVTMRKRMRRKHRLREFTAELIASSSSPYFDWTLQVVSDRGNCINVNSLLEVEVYSHDQDHPFVTSPKWWRSTWRPSPMSGGHRRTGYESQFSQFFAAIDSGGETGHSIESVLSMYELMDRIHAHGSMGTAHV